MEHSTSLWLRLLFAMLFVFALAGWSPTASAQPPQPHAATEPHEPAVNRPFLWSINWPAVAIMVVVGLFVAATIISVIQAGSYGWGYAFWAMFFGILGAILYAMSRASRRNRGSFYSHRSGFSSLWSGGTRHHGSSWSGGSSGGGSRGHSSGGSWSGGSSGGSSGGGSSFGSSMSSMFGGGGSSGGSW